MAKETEMDMKREMEQIQKTEAEDGWTKEEKEKFYEVVKATGKLDLKTLQEQVPTKSVVQLQDIIISLTKTALEQSSLQAQQKNNKPESSRGKEKQKQTPSPPLTEWQKKVMEALDLDLFCTETPSALRIHARTADIPPPNLTENINFKEIYLQMANAMEGNPIVADELTSTVLQYCVAETAKRANAHLRRNPALEQFVRMLNSGQAASMISQIPVQVQEPTDDLELATLRHLTSQRAYNPLNIPEEFLKLPFEKTVDETEDEKE